ncbi:hypothetical protein BB559_004589 [Furculomyces boomerangus]|uniref:L-lactate dehydrogenase n=2 Tax=Harpellales TaxID=61421 RepID=A0A2T9YDQ7_9FUNG|nr:hypothetical protein BB559_004589 [Furculomyces boomerangus]PVZ97896.1 hypothetical protein BB558_006131 [Smittium angustum]
MAPKSKVAIIGGAGNVGAAIAFALVVMQIPAEVLLVDVTEEVAKGQALDISDAAHLSCAKCRVGTFEEAGQADVIIITAGARQNPGESRSNLIDRNYAILKSIITKISPIKPTAIILMVSNPVDILTSIAQKLTGLPKNHVLGSGTFLDSGRLRNHLSNLLKISSSSIHANMLGEHGDSQFVGWSTATIAGAPLLDHPIMENIDLDKVEKEIANKAYSIIDAKGSTYFGIGMHVAVLTRSILNNDLRVFPVSNYHEEYDTYLSLPAVVGASGASRVDIQLNSRERTLLQESAKKIKDICDKY